TVRASASVETKMKKKIQEKNIRSRIADVGDRFGLMLCLLICNLACAPIIVLWLKSSRRGKFSESSLTTRIRRTRHSDSFSNLSSSCLRDLRALRGANSLHFGCGFVALKRIEGRHDFYLRLSEAYFILKIDYLSAHRSLPWVCKPFWDRFIRIS